MQENTLLTKIYREKINNFDQQSAYGAEIWNSQFLQFKNLKTKSVYTGNGL
jgi:hypothetical protein